MPSHANLKTIPKLLGVVKPPSKPRQPGFKPQLMESLARKHKLLSIPSNLPKNVAHVGGDRSYVLVGSLARLEAALMRWTLNQLIHKYKFTPVVVPNILHDHIIDRCGFPTNSERSQVYKISGSNESSILDEDGSSPQALHARSNPCIAGTSEFALASIHIGDSIPAEELPKRYCALSRCYRAETSSLASEWGLYRVHYFKKVEMFAFTMPQLSEEMHREFVDIQKDLFSQLGLHFQILDMPEDDLGLSASRKYDIEAWLPGRDRFGEISSASLCGDYQSSRLDIRFSQMIEKDDQLQIDNGYVHTINGTACSSIRTLMAICEQHQTEEERVELPDVLVPYMDGERFIPTERDLKQLDALDLYPEPNTP